MTKTDLWVCPPWADLFLCSLTQWWPPHPSNCISSKPRRSLSLSLHSQPISKFHWFLPSYCLTDIPTSLQLYHHLSISSMVHHNYLLTHLLQQLHLPFTSLFSTLQLLLNVFFKCKSDLSNTLHWHPIDLGINGKAHQDTALATAYLCGFICFHPHPFSILLYTPRVPCSSFLLRLCTIISSFSA